MREEGNEKATGKAKEEKSVLILREGKEEAEEKAKEVLRGI